MIARLQRWAALVGVFILAIAGAVFAGRQGGRKAAELETLEETVDKQREIMGVAREIDQSINSGNNSAQRLRDDWMRDDSEPGDK